VLAEFGYITAVGLGFFFHHVAERWAALFGHLSAGANLIVFD
jgi:hypothetical protein